MNIWWSNNDSVFGETITQIFDRLLSHKRTNRSFVTFCNPSVYHISPMWKFNVTKGISFWGLNIEENNKQRRETNCISMIFGKRTHAHLLYVASSFQSDHAILYIHHRVSTTTARDCLITWCQGIYTIGRISYNLPLLQI